MRPNDLQRSIDSLKRFLRSERLTQAQRKRLHEIVVLMESAQIDHEIALAEAQQMGLRHAEFDGDWVGRPDDDFAD